MNKLDLKNRCPVDLAIDVVGGKWKSIILYRLGAGTLRFGQLQRAIPHVTQRMLTLQLRELERDGLVVRTVYPEVPPKVEYTLSVAARCLLPVLESLGQWLVDHHGELRRAVVRKVSSAQQHSEPAERELAIEGSDALTHR